jgi:mRNA interferase MazF
MSAIIHQGDIYWISLPKPTGSAPGFRRPGLVIQNNLFNRSRLNTVVICLITSNLKRGGSPGNVELAQGEANLPQASVVNVTQLYTVDRSQLTERIGTLSRSRLLDVIRGIQGLIEPQET